MKFARSVFVIVMLLTIGVACNNANMTVTGLTTLFSSHPAPESFQANAGGATLNANVPTVSSSNTTTLRANVKSGKSVVLTSGIYTLSAEVVQ